MNNFNEIDFSHAYVAIMAAAEFSDNVTEQEMEMLKSVLLKAKAEREPIKCPHCGSTNCGMSDYESLAMGENLEIYGQYDSELYTQFTCFDCREDFRKVLEISHQ
jgi:uncharacterized protein with PIN domain